MSKENVLKQKFGINSPELQAKLIELHLIASKELIDVAEGMSVHESYMSTMLKMAGQDLASNDAQSRAIAFVLFGNIFKALSETEKSAQQ